MSYLFRHLPPFAADYSGVASAFHDLGGLIVIHDASGCTGSFTGYDEPRWYHGNASVYCSGLREFDAILGNDQRLLDNLRQIAGSRDFSFIAIVGSPVPMLVGFDFHGFATLVESETGIPTLGFPTTGLACYHHGLDSAYRAFAERFLPVPLPGPLDRAVNILGASPLDNFTPDSVDQLRALVAAQGGTVLSVWGQGDGFAAMQHAPAAQLNLVVSSAALPLAQYFARRWEQPFVLGAPLGEHGQASLGERLRRALDRHGDGPADAVPPAGRAAGASAGSVLLLGEQLQMNALRDALRRSYPGVSVAVAGFFAWAPSLAEAQDAHFANEEAAQRFIHAGHFDVLVGDPLFRSLPGHDDRVAYVDCPHYAVSGRIYRDHTVSSQFGAEAGALLDRIGAGLAQRQHRTTCRTADA